jgi:hypothetical protein
MVTGRKEEDELFLRELPAVTARVKFVDSYHPEQISKTSVLESTPLL